VLPGALKFNDVIQAYMEESVLFSVRRDYSDSIGIGMQIAIENLSNTQAVSISRLTRSEVSSAVTSSKRVYSLSHVHQFVSHMFSSVNESSRLAGLEAASPSDITIVDLESMFAFETMLSEVWRTNA
jgi:hypothetical protein